MGEFNCSLLSNGEGNAQQNQHKQDQTALYTQLVISIALGLGAFITFCALRPRWTGLYAARKRQKNAASNLPVLPDTFFGWIPVLYKISEEQVLASAGLDAYVFLSFFRMAIKFLAITFFVALVIILPVNVHYLNYSFPPSHSPQVLDYSPNPRGLSAGTAELGGYSQDAIMTAQGSSKYPSILLWMYVVFTYLFASLAMYLLVTTTQKVIRIRQEYLGSQTTVTDRTIRLSGIPSELRDEEKIKETIENLEIGKVESVILCRNWKELDDMMAQRLVVLRKLEEAWTVHLGHSRARSTQASRDRSQSRAAVREDAPLLEDGDDHEQNHVVPYGQDRPKTRIWFGFMGLQSHLVDAIDYYEERLRKLDEKIETTRKKDFKPTPLAFVTLDSVAACQMAVQATMDPRPLQLQANPAPPPSDVIWQNTYLTRSSRIIRAWSVTFIILLLTVFWTALLVPIAGLVSLKSICSVWPQLAFALDSNPISQSLVATGLPTALISLLTVLVPFLYYWLSTQQGMLSQGEVEMSLISKNFFFTFFNLFVLFTIFGTASISYAKVNDTLAGASKDASEIARKLATSLQDLDYFYINLIILQALGLFPFRLLEFGSVALYPITLIGAKTPRDYAELVQPPVFSYGFYLPQTLLVFVICTVYSVLQSSWLILFFGLVYFLIGSFIYKYQLLYAMDHRQHSTGQAWLIICNCVTIGLIFFEIAMAGLLALRTAFYRSVLIIPLLAGTIWFSIFFRRTFDPLMKFIALRSLDSNAPFGDIFPGETRYERETDNGRAVDEDDETGLRYINPSLVIPLEEVWLAKGRPNGSSHADGRQEETASHSSFSVTSPKTDPTVSPPSSSRPALHLNTKVGHPRLAAVHFDTPLRPRASTRGSPVEIIGSSPPFLPRPDYEPGSTDSEDEIWMRGRSAGDASQPGSKSHVAVAFDPAPNAANLDRQTPAIEGQGSLSSELTDAEQFLKEPQPPERVHTNLFGILASSATFNEMDLTGFFGHRDTLAMLTLRRARDSKDLPIEVFSHIAQYVDFQTYKSVRLTCRGWSTAFTYVRPLQFPPVWALPAEILKEVYSYLSPLDLNAARHTCRKWMIASLEHRLLARVIESAGFSGAAKADATLNEKLGHPTGGEWRLSKRLATECSLSPGWTGGGFPRTPTEPYGTSLGISSTIEFLDLSVPQQHRQDQQPSLRFVVSTCGEILFVLVSTVIWVYCIRDFVSPPARYQHGGHIEFLVSIICPYPVLAVSMDTSGNRYTIAALLESRTGLVIDVPELALMARRSGPSSPHSERDTYNVTNAWDIKYSPTATPTTSQRLDLPPSYTDVYHASPIAHTPVSGQSSQLPIQFIPHVMYRNLCSKSAPPLSVAICPHRRCVAFGSLAGIELHWQDARTGQELSRWVELVGPAEYIHFLPLRAEDEQDVARKLRLVSSRAGPKYYHDPIPLNKAWDYERCTFLRAVPLSDGKHLLYTDPASGELSLGTGLHHPFGRPKPVKEFVLAGPERLFEDKTAWPACYRAGTELEWGARIVAGFGEDIWLFRVPPDFLLDATERDPVLNDGVYPKREDGTMVIKGVKIGEMQDLVELAVDASAGDLTIHAFSSSSARAQVYQIQRYPPQDIRERYVASDGRAVCRDRNENLVTKGYVPEEAESYSADKEDYGSIKDTAYRRLDDGHDVPVERSPSDDDEEMEEMKDQAVGDWVHGTGEEEEKDEGYASDGGTGPRHREWGWSDAATGFDGDDEGLDLDLDYGREAEWDVMALVRLEVEVLCGG
ncbi:MAG: hypothetical protein Q9210_002153 [Variospora velana]